MSAELLTQGEVEGQIAAYIDRLESTTQEFGSLIEAAANAEFEYKRKHDSLVIGHTNRGTKSTTIRPAVAAACLDEWNLWKMADARVESCRQALLSWRAILNALQSLSANIRAQT